VAGSFEHGNESPGSLKCGEFFDWLRAHELVKNDSTARSWLVTLF
jgi:hypothetical protein